MEIQKPKEKLSTFVQRLNEVCDHIQKKLQDKKEEGKDTEKMSGSDFEKVVYSSFIEAGFDRDSVTYNSQKFPDFVLEDKETGARLGVEVKKTDGAKWEVIGGSIYESLRNDVNDTYVLMAKLGGDKPEVRFKKYEECIADLKVTHSPRFYLNLDLKEGEDFLTKNNAKDLLELSDNELNRKIRQLLRTKKSTWWSEGETAAYSDLNKEEKDIYLNEGIALFPQVFKGDYQKFTPWLVYSCFVWCGNVRDIFSSGGNKFVEELGIYVSAIMYRTLDNIESIRQRILEMTDKEQEKVWGRVVQTKEERLKTWIGFVEENIRISPDLIRNNKKLQRFQGCKDSDISLGVREIYMNFLKTIILMDIS